MPLFYFDVSDGDHRFEDAEGSDLPNRMAARKEALEAVAEIGRGPMLIKDRRDLAIEVREPTGEVVFHATMSLTGRWSDNLSDEVGHAEINPDVSGKP